MKVYLAYGINMLLNAMSAEVFKTRQEAEEYADTYLDNSKIEEREV